MVCLLAYQLTWLVFRPPQGPCTGNQQSLAHSRLWDAVVGFLHVFAHMQMKLSQVGDCSVFIGLTYFSVLFWETSYFTNHICFYWQDSSQIELLKDLMDLQKDMVVMLLSMLEGMTQTNKNVAAFFGYSLIHTHSPPKMSFIICFQAMWLTERSVNRW